MPVRVRKALDRRPRHQEGLEDAFVHDGHRTGRHAFVVEAIPAVEVDARDFLLSRVEDDREKIRQHGTVDALGESLSLGLVLLTMALDAMSEDFVKEYAGGAAGEDGGPDKWIDDRGLQQPHKLPGDTVDGGLNLVVLW